MLAEGFLKLLICLLTEFAIFTLFVFTLISFYGNNIYSVENRSVKHNDRVGSGVNYSSLSLQTY